MDIVNNYSEPMIKNLSNKKYVAHVHNADSSIQPLSSHLQEVADIAKKLAAKINVLEAGELIGLLHDFGKYSDVTSN